MFLTILPYSFCIGGRNTILMKLRQIFAKNFAISAITVTNSVCAIQLLPCASRLFDYSFFVFDCDSQYICDKQPWLNVLSGCYLRPEYTGQSLVWMPVNVWVRKHAYYIIKPAYFVAVPVKRYRRIGFRNKNYLRQVYDFYSFFF